MKHLGYVVLGLACFVLLLTTAQYWITVVLVATGLVIAYAFGWMIVKFCSIMVND